MIYNVGSGGSSTAEAIQYDNYESGLTADNVQDAIDENANNMGGVRFGIDGDGNYGYYKADDSFIPFKSGGGLENPIVIKSGDWLSDTSYTFTNDYSTVIFIVNTGGAKNGIPAIPDTTVKLNGTAITKVMQINSQTYSSNIYGRVGTHLFVLHDIKSGDKVTMTNTISYGVFGE